jgi:hypothetical protein
VGLLVLFVVLKFSGVTAKLAPFAVRQAEAHLAGAASVDHERPSSSRRPLPVVLASG